MLHRAFLILLIALVAACVPQELERPGLAYVSHCTAGDNLYPTQCTRLYADDMLVRTVEGNADGTFYDSPVVDEQKQLASGSYARVLDLLDDPPAEARRIPAAPPIVGGTGLPCCHVSYATTALAVDAGGTGRAVNDTVLIYALNQVDPPV
ncbi:hypothetical protein [Pelagovum pacificum]|uniref:Uncharacterized protein n=1 Tax=Pelagovum pacificum TaxID=2588711 RepID=A0A5C5GBB1_9RHOB|nr:hypothetical protein [Pelagovum pacificum]QQA42283.1 hypothetical protein I8N54_16030 [Pelagovum pacificum]TNY31367.1 hypothetical protein FHY64_15220 [Pelagovum pacificum]